MHIVDRRLNPGGKSLANRQRFMRRAKSLIRKAVHESTSNRSIKDADEAGEVSLPAQGVHEPSFHRSLTGGIRDHLLPGNKEYVAGDTIPAHRETGGAGSEGSPDGDGQDDFRFALSRDEFVDLFLEDLELPDLAKRRVVDTESLSWERAGYSVNGSPANLALMRTVRNGLARRIALRRPKTEELRALREQINALAEDDAGRAVLLEELERKLRRTGLIPYMDPVDVRYRRFEAHPKPVAQAVMFCLMDVSGSMRAHEGPGEAVLCAAVHFSQAQIQARGSRVHQAYTSGGGGGRGYILPFAGNRGDGGFHGAGRDAPGGRGAI